MKRILAIGNVLFPRTLSLGRRPANVDWSHQRQGIAARATPEWAIWERMPRIAQSVVSSWEGKYVFVSGDRVYDIKNRTLRPLAASVGGSVQLTRDVDKEVKTITVTKVAPTGKVTEAVRRVDRRMVLLV